MNTKDMHEFSNVLDQKLKCLKKLLEVQKTKKIDINGEQLNELNQFFRKPMIGMQNVAYDNSSLNGNQPGASIPTAGKLPHMDTIRPYTTFDMHSIRNQAQIKFRTTLDEREFLRQHQQDENHYRTHVAETMNYAFNAYTNGNCKYSNIVPVSGGPSIPKGYGITKLGRSCGGTYTTTHPGSLSHARGLFDHSNKVWQNENSSLEQKIQTQFNRPSEEVELQGHNGHIYKGRLNNESSS